MGGCRCTFRDCTNNSTNSPGMHFFHFPHKDSVRCQKWAQYSGNPHFPSLERAKLRNKVVCETHFRDECFMNYKKERLVQWAIPTLTRLLNGSVLDYNESDNPSPRFLEPTVLEHLVPPGNRQEESLKEVGADSVFTVDFVSDILEDQDENVSQVSSPSPPLPRPPKLRRMKMPPPRILNISAPQNLKLHALRLEPIVAKTTDETSFAVSEIAVEETTASAYEEVYSEESAQTITLCEPVVVVDNEKPDTVLKSVFETRETELQKEIASLRGDLDQKDRELAERDSELAEAKKRIEIFETKAVTAVTQVETITTSRSKETPAQSAPMTKAQLFNGIKKYLSPSMAAMVRMEMFGGPEREWKPDEKAVSVELLNLGEHVFSFIRDEWRCRLPPKRDVEQWLSQRGDVDDEEDL